MPNSPAEQPEPLSRAALVERIADRLAGRTRDHPLRVAVDGALESRAAALADDLVDPLRLRGRPAVRISTEDFQRAAALRFERGRDDPQAWYEDAYDTGALRREVLDPLGPGGSLRYLPTLWDPVRDRATRAAYAHCPPGAVVLVDGVFLLRPPPLRGREGQPLRGREGQPLSGREGQPLSGREEQPRRLPFDIAVHVHLSDLALRRRVPPERAGQRLPAYARYAAEVHPREVADLVVLLDDPAHPALVDRLRSHGATAPSSG